MLRSFLFRAWQFQVLFALTWRDVVIDIFMVCLFALAVTNQRYMDARAIQTKLISPYFLNVAYIYITKCKVWFSYTHLSVAGIVVIKVCSIWKYLYIAWIYYDAYQSVDKTIYSSYVHIIKHILPVLYTLEPGLCS